jgi:hypothetical protein
MEENKINESKTDKKFEEKVIKDDNIENDV